MTQYPEEVRQAARSLYLRRYRIREIAQTLNIPARTLYDWADKGDWDALLCHETPKEAASRRLSMLMERDGKTPAELKEIDTLTGVLERLSRLSGRQRGDGDGNRGGSEKGKAAGRARGAGRGGGKKTIKNDVSHLTEKDFREKLHGNLFPYQYELRGTKQYRNRMFLKSRQIGFTWYFAQEAFEDAALTGDNQIFLSATRAQAEVFRGYIVDLAADRFGIELKGNPLVLHTAGGSATLYFLSNNSKSAQSYHGHVYIDEFFWIQKFAELFKVATGMAAHRKWRRTMLSTPSAVTHQAYPYWTGDNYRKRFKKKHVEFPGFRELRSGILCPDNTYRKIVTLKDAEKGGCDLFDRAELELEYSPEEFRNLFMCEFVDDTMGVFRLADLEACAADPDDWTDFAKFSDRPLGNHPVWCGYDPSRSRDDASFVVIAPSLTEDGPHRVVEKHKWLDKSFTWQAERIREICGRYNVQHMAVDTTGPGLGVFEMVQAFYPAATPIHYSVAAKNQLVLKAREVIEGGRLRWDAAHNDIAHAFLTIRQGVSENGQITYSAGRTAATGHADAAWAVMHALSHEPIRRGGSGCVVDF